MDFNLILGGAAGKGMLSVENKLVELLSKNKYFFFATKNYMSRIKGGHNYHMLRISDKPVGALSGDKWDMFVAYDQVALDWHRKELKKSAVVYTPEKLVEISTRFNNDHKAVNDSVAEEIFAVVKAKLKPGKKEYKVFNGNQALAFGSILGGCQFMSAYPMTPATSIMDYFAKAAVKLPIHFEQAEDEISAINMAIGASYAGVRAITATSGGGFALMQEGVSLIGMTETPLVIIDSQRPAPATGLPTRTEQADLNFVLYSGHGEFPRAIFAPGSPDECLEIASEAFELADQTQSPVFILTDQYLADSYQPVFGQIISKVNQREYLIQGKDYLRYKLTPSGISPLTYSGLSEALVKCDSDEHTEEGKITEDLDVRIKMVDKRLKKNKIFLKKLRKTTWYGNKKAKRLLVCWGSNKQIVQEVVDILGGKYAMLHFSQVYPLPDLSDYKQKITVIENNATGQFANLFKQHGGKVAKNILKYNGECFTVKELVEKIRG